MDSIVTRMDSIASTLSGRKAEVARVEQMYWKTYLMLPSQGREKAFAVADSARALAEKLGNEYLCNRLDDLTDVFFNRKSTETLGALLNFYDYYGKVGDLGQQGNMAMLISNNLLYPPIPELSMRYLNTADSLFALAGLENRREGLRINRLSLRFNLGDTIGIKNEYENLLASARRNNDINLQELLLRNYYFFTHDSAAIYEGYEIVRKLAHPDSAATGLSAFRGLYEALISDNMLSNNDLNGGGKFARLCEKHLDEMRDLDELELAYSALGNYYAAIGDYKKASYYRGEYVKVRVEKDTEIDQPLSKISIERLDTIHRHEMENEAERQVLKIRLYVISGVSLLVILLIIAGVVRWRSRQRMKTLQLTLEAERNQRRILAMQMHSEEADKLLDSVKTQMERMAHEGVAKNEEATRIEQNVKLHIAGKSEKETFEEAFAAVSPEFTKRLKERAPGLTASNIRLCTYIYMGLTPHEIASLMHITDNGLRVARHRLRQKFNLGKDEPLETFLQNL